MTDDKLVSRINENQRRLTALILKKENIEREIINLENRLQNQQFALNHQKQGQ